MTYLRSLPNGTRSRSRLEVLDEMRAQAMDDPDVIAWIDAQVEKEKARLDSASREDAR